MTADCFHLFTIKRLVGSLISLLLIIPAAFADSSRDFTIFEAQSHYFDLPRLADTSGVAGSNVPTQRRTSAIWGNPAGIGAITSPDVTLAYSNDSIAGADRIEDGDFDEELGAGSIILSTPFGSDREHPVATLSFGFYRFYGDADDALATGKDGHLRSMALGAALSDDWRIGYGGSFIDDEIEDDLIDYHSHNRYRHTFGTQYDYSDDLMLGGLFFYGDGKSDSEVFETRADGDSYIRELGGQVGVSARVSRATWTGALEYRNYYADGFLDTDNRAILIGGDEHGDALILNAGLSYKLNSWLEARTGASVDVKRHHYFRREAITDYSGDGSTSSISAGLGMLVPLDTTYVHAMRFDYAIEGHNVSDLAWQHSFLLSFTL